MKYSESLKKNNDFQFIYQNGTSKANRYLVMYVLHHEHKRNRLGICVSKKIGNSVVRHRVTRLVRESYRQNEDHFQQGIDLIVVARPACRDISFWEMQSALLHLAGLHQVLLSEENF